MIGWGGLPECKASKYPRTEMRRSHPSWGWVDDRRDVRRMWMYVFRVVRSKGGTM